MMCKILYDSVDVDGPVFVISVTVTKLISLFIKKLPMLGNEIVPNDLNIMI